MLSKGVETRAKLNNLLQECESKPEEKIDNKVIIPCFSKVEKIHPTETWSYCILYSDGTSMTSSNNIKLEGIGLSVPTTPEISIIGQWKSFGVLLPKGRTSYRKKLLWSRKHQRWWISFIGWCLKHQYWSMSRLNIRFIWIWGLRKNIVLCIEELAEAV